MTFKTSADDSACLPQKLYNLIQANHGSLSVHDYMAFCLHDPDHGYYTTKSPLGRNGDFITSPEISQVFGESIGLWIISIYETLGQPDLIHCVELGPGRGLLMRDALRVIQKHPKASGAIRLSMVEINTPLKQNQINACAPHQITHFETVDDALNHLTDTPLIVIANEFFDALPIRQYIFRDQKWRERHISITEDLQLKFIEGQSFDCLETPLNRTPQDGDICEKNIHTASILQSLCTHIHRNRGAGLVIDYGHLNSGYGDTLQAIQSHKMVSPLSQPGNCDLTTHIDFEHLSAIAKQNKLNTQMGTQAEFLKSFGIDIRTQNLIDATTNSQQKQSIKKATQRLIDPEHMGELFKVLSFWMI